MTTVGLSSLTTHSIHLCGYLRLRKRLTNPDVHMLNCSWKLIYTSHPVLELEIDGDLKRKWGDR